MTKYQTAYGRAVDLRRKLRDEYDVVLAEYDVLVMPTTTQPPRRQNAFNAGPVAWWHSARMSLAF